MNDILKSDDQTRPDSHLILRGNPKTLIPSPRTPAMDWVLGLPYGSIYGLPLRKSSTERPKNEIKIINKDFSQGLSNRLLVPAKRYAVRM